MKKTLIAISVLYSGLTFSNDYVTLIQNDKTYEVGGFTTEIIYTEWALTGNKNCSVDKEESDFYYGVSFTQLESCDAEESRTKTKERTYTNGHKEIVSVETEYKYTPEADKSLSKTGSHLESSCDDIFQGGYSSSNGLFKIGNESDSFDVYCKMENGIGWTLIAKSPPSDGASPHTTKRWFVDGINQGDLNRLEMDFKTEKSAFGLTTIDKISHKNQIKVEFVSDNQAKQVDFYKTVLRSNMDHWFLTTEPTPTLTCIDANMTQACESRSFEYFSTRYWLRGMTLEKYGYEVVSQPDKDIHFSYPTPNEISSSMCSSTGNRNNNAWPDTQQDGHWGNGMRVFIK